MSDGPLPAPELRIVDAATGAIVWRGAAPPPAVLARGLAALGLTDTGSISIELRDDDGSGKLRGVFPGTKLGVIVAKDQARALTGDHVLGEIALASSDRHAFAIRTPIGVIVGAQVDIGDGCGGWDFDAIGFMPIVGLRP
jgi:hypothetical protein